MESEVVGGWALKKLEKMSWKGFIPAAVLPAQCGVLGYFRVHAHDKLCDVVELFQSIL